MAIISCPECGRQVSDKALKWSQCNYPIANLEKQESVALQALQEKIQGVVTNGLTVKVSSVGKLLNIKLTRTPVTSVSYDQLWLKISQQLKTDDLKGFSQILISAYSERDIIKSEWESQNDINGAGVILPNKKDIIAISVFVAILIVGFSGCTYLFNLPHNVETISSPSSPILSTSSPEYLLAGIDNQSKDVSASELVPYIQVLDQLESKCQESRMALADMSAATKEILTKKGAKATNLELLNGVYQAVQSYENPQKCAAGFALFATYVDK
ncbi:MAG: hypothetical protein DCE90_19245 [Pseudanabaena sp.]|nr:MAG: hypothetical protein DCE90_19245 [Pseudanabaena sp.]